MPEMLDPPTERLLARSLKRLPAARRAEFEQTWRAELGALTGEERLEFARGLPAAAARLAWQFDTGFRLMRPFIVTVAVFDVLKLLQSVFFPALLHPGASLSASDTLLTGLHLSLALWALVRALRFSGRSGEASAAPTRTLRRAGIVTGLFGVLLAFIWRGVVDPSASPFLISLMFSGVGAAFLDLMPHESPSTNVA